MNVSVLFSDRPVSEQAFHGRLLAGPGEPLVPGLLEGAWKSLHSDLVVELKSLGPRISGKARTATDLFDLIRLAN